MVEDGEAEERRWEGGFHRGGFVLVWGMGWRMEELVFEAGVYLRTVV